MYPRGAGVDKKSGAHKTEGSPPADVIMGTVGGTTCYIYVLFNGEILQFLTIRPQRSLLSFTLQSLSVLRTDKVMREGWGDSSGGGRIWRKNNIFVLPLKIHGGKGDLSVRIFIYAYIYAIKR